MISQLALFEAEYPLQVFAISLVFGSLIGSFLNVVIHRMPIMMQKEWESQANEVLGQAEEAQESETYNLIFPNSHCPKCDYTIKPWENIPIVSYLFLKGKCSSCGNRISPRYPLIELVTGVLTAIVILNFGLNLTGLTCCILTWALLSLALIDFDHQFIPDDITLPMLWLGLICNYFDLITLFGNAFWGAVTGYLVLWSVFQVFKLVTGKEGMGYGDFKMLAMLGAWMGWQMLPLIVILSSMAGAIIGGALIFFGRDRAVPISFGPFLAIAGWIALLWGNEITQMYLKFTAF
ncbi:MAG: A24 family peptidase [Pseudomonadales bacterium]|jgi:leader peptidase (prepilin peptidase)/N-methyltransferase|nr:A24 family peptidase [Pseudomonadales bacterium]MDP6316059.1 A24 family peptidase [Pseudomonadales bacterium]MDP7313946.1 A24 family peptidase [Pseudomonadales bacterium]|tara:strand:- start:774 stop:1649 length:876 start_codon:yes stop_codon:yes gene_type:complete